jgi:hypothetical protein
MAFPVLLMAIGACSKDSTNDDISNDYKLEKGNFTFLKNTKIFKQAEKERSDGYSDEFEINKVERIGDTLNITVSFYEGCEINKFEVIWDGSIMLSYPEMTIFFVKRTADNCGEQGELKTQVLSLSIVEIIGDEALAKRINVTVSNASKKVDEENADIFISNKN